MPPFTLPAGEGITPEQNASNSVAGTPITVTMGSAIKVNSLLVLCANLATATANVTTPSGYSIANQKDFPVATRSLHMFYKIAGASESTTSASLAWTGGGNGRAVWLEYSGLVSVLASVLDIASSGTATAATSFAMNTFGGTANLFVGCLGTVSGNGGSTAMTNSWTVRNNTQNNIFAGDDADALSLGGTTASWLTANDCAHITAAFRSQIKRTTPVLLQAVSRAGSF